jgi:hypothetical protein
MLQTTNRFLRRVEGPAQPGLRTMQNSLPSGSERTTNGSSGSSLTHRRAAPNASICLAVASSSFAAKSMWTRFFTTLPSGTWKPILVLPSGARIGRPIVARVTELEPRERNPELSEPRWVCAVDHDLVEADLRTALASGFRATRSVADRR